MATFVKYQQFIEDVFNKKHDFGNDTFKIVWSNTAPTVASDNVLADAGEIASGNGYTAGGEAIAITSAVQTAGVLSVVPTADVDTIASGGTIGPLRYAILINDTADLLVSYHDRGASATLLDGENILYDVGSTLFTAQ